MSTQAREIPAEVRAEEAIEIQLAPFGEYPGVLHFLDPATGKPAKKKIVQKLDAAALNAVAGAFKPEVLVDKEHLSEHGGDSAAYGWVKRLRVDPAEGLMGTVAFTPPGADVVNSRVYRFPSCAFDIEELPDGRTVRPTALTSVALTNKKNLPVRSVLNRAEAPGNETPVEDNKETQAMEEIAKILGVGNDPAAVVAAIQALQKKAADLEAAARGAEADKFVEENKGKVQNSAALREAYLADPEQTRKVIALFSTPAAAPKGRVTNSAEAALAPRIEADKGDVLAVYNSLNGAEKKRFLRENAEAIHAARVAADQE